MVKKLGLAGVLAAAVWTAGCLEKETTHTLYLSPDGEVTWTAFERNVRSDAPKATEREREEAEYLAAALGGTHAVAKGLEALEAARVETRVLRRARPLTVMTEARFTSVEALANRVIAGLRLQGDAYTTVADGIVTLRVHLDFRGVEAEEGSATAVTALIEEIGAYRIVLTEGQFEGVEGFTLSGGNSIAAPIGVSEEEMKATGVLDLSLSWRR